MWTMSHKTIWLLTDSRSNSMGTNQASPNHRLMSAIDPGRS